MRLSVRVLAPSSDSFVALLLAAPTTAQVAGQNVNMVSGTKWPTGDPFLQTAERTVHGGLDAKSDAPSIWCERLSFGGPGDRC